VTGSNAIYEEVLGYQCHKVGIRTVVLKLFVFKATTTKFTVKTVRGVRRLNK